MAEVSRSMDPDEQTITLEGEDGQSYECRILGVFDFEGKEYALLLKLGSATADTDEGQETATIIMRLFERDDQAVFQTIESDEEFERVMAFIKEVAREMDADNTDAG